MKGTEKRIARSVRIEPSKKELIERMYGSLQKWFDGKVEEEFGTAHEAVIIRKEKKKPEKETVTIDDF